MHTNREGQIAVIFSSIRTGEDELGYAAAAIAMEDLAKQQPGYCGMMSCRGDDGFGLTISYWATEAAAIAWRNNAEHSQIRDAGRARWYSAYTLDVTHVVRNYDWQSDG